MCATFTLFWINPCEYCTRCYCIFCILLFCRTVFFFRLFVFQSCVFFSLHCAKAYKCTLSNLYCMNIKIMRRWIKSIFLSTLFEIRILLSQYVNPEHLETHTILDTLLEFKIACNTISYYKASMYLLASQEHQITSKAIKIKHILPAYHFQALFNCQGQSVKNMNLILTR